jgi:hypothetical protein
MLLQNPDDLLFAVPALLHPSLPHSIYERIPASNGRDFRGQVKWSRERYEVRGGGRVYAGLPSDKGRLSTGALLVNSELSSDAGKQ